MTGNDWLTCEDPELMLSHLEGKITDREMRLFGVACIRRVWHLLRYERGRDAVGVAERFARGDASRSELAAAFASLTKIPVPWGFINVPSPRWVTPEPSEPLLNYSREPGDHGTMVAAWSVCLPDARLCASKASCYAADAVADVAWHRAEVELDWKDFRETHRQAKVIQREAKAMERREQARILRERVGGGTSGEI